MSRARRGGAAAAPAFALLKAVYEDGSRSASRKIRLADLGDGDASALALLQTQERKIAEMTHRPGRKIKAVERA